MSDTSPSGTGSAAPADGREPLLDQAEIDAILGTRAPEGPAGPNGARAMLGAGATPPEPMPMLRVVFDDLAGRLSQSLRGLFGQEVEVTVASLGPRRYGELVDEVVLPAQLVTFRAEGLDGSGLVFFGPDFAGLTLDALLGAGPQAGRLLLRPFSPIETAIFLRITDLVLFDAGECFRAVTPVRFLRERSEQDPRLAAIAGPGEMALAATLRLALGTRTCQFGFVLPLSTLEPVRGTLRSGFMGAKRGHDDYWSGHLATAIWQSEVAAEAVLHEVRLPLRQVLGLSVGDTLMFDRKPGDLVEVRCGSLPVTRGQIGRVDGRIAVQVVEPVSRPGAPNPQSLPA